MQEAAQSNTWKLKCPHMGWTKKIKGRERPSRLYWKRCLPTWLGDADKVQLLFMYESPALAAAKGCAHCGENKAGWAVLHCHGLKDRGNETEAFGNSKHFCAWHVYFFFQISNGATIKVFKKKANTRSGNKLTVTHLNFCAEWLGMQSSDRVYLGQ